MAFSCSLFLLKYTSLIWFSMKRLEALYRFYLKMSSRCIRISIRILSIQSHLRENVFQCFDSSRKWIKHNLLTIEKIFHAFITTLFQELFKFPEKILNAVVNANWTKISELRAVLILTANPWSYKYSVFISAMNLIVFSMSARRAAAMAPMFPWSDRISRSSRHTFTPSKATLLTIFWAWVGTYFLKGNREANDRCFEFGLK